MNRTKKICFTVLAGTVCAALLFLPWAWSAAAEHLLVGSSTVRPMQEGLLSERARRIPVLYAVHAARMLQLTIPPVSPSEWTDAADPAQELEDFRALACDLEQAGVLTQNDLAALERVLSGESIRLQTAQNHFFSSLSRTYSEPKAYPFRELASCIHTDSGLAAAVTLPFEAEQSAEKILLAYREYLALDALDDWVEITPPVSDLHAGEGAAMWSSEGQAYLYCTKDSIETSVGLSVMSEEEVDKFF